MAKKIALLFQSASDGCSGKESTEAITYHALEKARKSQPHFDLLSIGTDSVTSSELPMSKTITPANAAAVCVASKRGFAWCACATKYKYALV